MITATNIQIGTLIHGTLRSEDLIPAFTGQLANLSDGQHPLLDEINQFDWASEDIRLNIGDSQQEIASELVNDLMDALNEYAPPHTYFGTLEGDGSDFGFWADTEFSYCETEQDGDDNELWHDITCEVDLHVNDHGNLTLFDPNRNEIWSVV